MTHHSPRALLVACLSLAGLACPVSLAIDHDHHQGGGSRQALPVWEEATGRQVATFPRDRSLDLTHARIELDIPSMGDARLTGRVTYSTRVIGKDVFELALDCNGPQVTKVLVDGRPAQFSMRRARTWLGTFPSLRDVEGELPRQELVIALPTLSRAAPTIVVEYSLDFSNNRGTGLTWAGPTQTFPKPMIHAQGQTEFNSEWFPCVDSPAEFLTCEVLTTVEEGYSVISNGKLLGETTSRGRTTWHWSLDVPHATYLTTLAIGDFERIDVGGDLGARPGLPMPVWIERGNDIEAARATFARTAPMIAYFEQTFDEPFSFPQLGQAVIRGFASGGMENTGAIFYTPRIFDLSQERAQGLLAHEIAHQWWGSLVTCKGWEDLWINEGWATYCEALWAFHAAAPEGPAAQDEAYLSRVRSWLAGQIRDNRDPYPQGVAMGERRFRNPDDLFGLPDNPYGKGALLLHSVRERLGERVFLAAARTFLDEHARTPVETDDLRVRFERTSGVSLERLFDQTVRRPGIARLDATVRVEGQGVRIDLRQTQHIDARNPAFALRLPVVVFFADGTQQEHVVTLDTREASFVLACHQQPHAVVIDPRMSQIAEIRGRFTPFGDAAMTYPTPEALAEQRGAPAPSPDQPASTESLTQQQ